MTLLELRGIGLEVTTPVRTRILHPIDLEVTQGRTVAVTGPSGAGKTTLASIVGALQSPTEGSFLFAGSEMAGLSRRALVRYRRDHVGFVFQHSHLIEERTTLANVELGLVDHAMPRAVRRAAAMTALDTVGLADVAHRRAGLLSGGERHRAAVARALVKEPDLVIADEPTAALDQVTGAMILELLGRVTETGATLLIVSHDERAEQMADDVVHIVDGRRV